MALLVDIKKNFGSFSLRAQFETADGVLGILGASGSGKSVTLRCIAGILRPDEGHIELDGKVLFDAKKGIDLKPQQRQVGLLFQNYALFPNMTIRQNLMAPLRAARKDRQAAGREVDEMIQRFYLEGLEELKPFQLSGGQQQRAALARILLSKPHLLMLDEPFSALDEYLRWQLELELKQVLQQFDRPTLFVSHSRNEIYRMCDRICVMDQGQCAPASETHELFENPCTKAGALLSGCKNYSLVKRLEGEPDASGDDVTKRSSDRYVSGASKQKLNRYMAEDWGVILESTGIPPADLHWIGVRSHYVRPVKLKVSPDRKVMNSVQTGTDSHDHGSETRKDIMYDLPNVIDCEIDRVVEDVFSMVVMLIPKGGKAQLRMDLSKEEWREFCRGGKTPDTLCIWIDPHDVMLLE